MGEFLKDHLQSVMMISFLLATALGMYKVYVMFEKQAHEGIDIKTLEDEIIGIIGDIFDRNDVPSKKELYESIRNHPDFDRERHANFNENRFNQILERLYIRYHVKNYEDLSRKLS